MSEWQEHWGKGKYHPEIRTTNIEPYLEKLDSKGKIGMVVVDVGSGKFPVSEILKKENRKIVNLDIEAKDEESEGSLYLKADAGDDPSSLSFLRKLNKISKYLNIDPRESKEAVDSFIFSSLLNYVDFKTVIKNAGTYLKPGGRIIIFNKPGWGEKQLFSAKGVKNNNDLFDYLEENGYTIEDLQIDDPEITNSEMGEEAGRDNKMLLLSAKKIQHTT